MPWHVYSEIYDIVRNTNEEIISFFFSYVLQKLHTLRVATTHIYYYRLFFLFVSFPPLLWPIGANIPVLNVCEIQTFMPMFSTFHSCYAFQNIGWKVPASCPHMCLCFVPEKKAINVGCIPGALTSPTPSSLASLCCMQISIARGVPVLIVSPQNMLHIRVAEKWLRLHYFCAPHCWSINHAQRVSEYFFSFLIFFIILCMIYKYITPAIATRLWAKALRYQPFCIQQNGWPCGACEHFLIAFPQSLSLWHFSWEGFECGDVACLSRKWQT